MTDTTPITDGAGASQPIGTLEHLDPRSLTLELNVRDVADLDAEFLASIKEHGVLVPIAAVRDEHGTVWVRAAPWSARCHRGRPIGPSTACPARGGR